MLQQEAVLEARARDERSQHIMTREKTLMQHREKQEAKLRRIRQELSKSGSQYGSGGGNSVSPKGSYTNSVTPKESCTSLTPKDQCTSVTPKGYSMTPKETNDEEEIEEEILERLEIYEDGGGRIDKDE